MIKQSVKICSSTHSIRSRNSNNVYYARIENVNNVCYWNNAIFIWRYIVSLGDIILINNVGNNTIEFGFDVMLNFDISNNNKEFHNF